MTHGGFGGPSPTVPYLAQRGVIARGACILSVNLIPAATPTPIPAERPPR